jgi:hypothetical protein
MCVPLPHEQDTNSADTAYEIVCLRILDLCTVTMHCRAMPKRSHHADMNSEEYLAAVIEDGKVFIRCDKAGTPCPTGTHWKMRDDLFALMQECYAALDTEAARNS